MGKHASVVVIPKLFGLEANFASQWLWAGWFASREHLTMLSSCRFQGIHVDFERLSRWDDRSVAPQRHPGQRGLDDPCGGWCSVHHRHRILVFDMRLIPLQ